MLQGAKPGIYTDQLRIVNPVSFKKRRHLVGACTLPGPDLYDDLWAVGGNYVIKNFRLKAPPLQIYVKLIDREVFIRVFLVNLVQPLGHYPTSGDSAETSCAARCLKGSAGTSDRMEVEPYGSMRPTTLRSARFPR